jgi:hypothetical protein
MRTLLLVMCVVLTGLALAQTTPPLGHIVVVALENHSYSDVVGNPSMPYLNGLIRQYGLANSFYANVHGSFPDYAMLTTGELITQAGWGLPSDFPISIDNLARELTNAGKSWKVYAENLPSVGYTGGDVYPYVRRHNPFSYTSDVLNSSTQAGKIVPFSQFASDLNANTLPNFAFVIPNEENDAEDCPGGGSACLDSLKLSAADQWLQSNIAPLFSNPGFQQNGLLVIWWDEGNASDTSNGGGRLAVVLAGPTIKPGYRSSTFYRHENLLRTFAEGLGLGFPGASLYVQGLGEFFGANITPGSISGHVTDSSTGSAIAGASVSFSGGSALTDSNGAYAFTGVPAGTYSLTASHSGYANATSSVTVSAGVAATLNFQLTPTVSTGPGTITGRVTNISTGGAVSGATVSYSGGSTTTDTNGAYTFSGVAPGTYNVTASHTGFFNVTNPVTVSSGTTATLNFALATGGKVAGTVTNSSGAALANASVKISGGSIATTVTTTTISTGAYNSNWVPVGAYTVTVSAAGFSTQSKSVNVTTGNTATLNFTMQ